MKTQLSLVEKSSKKTAFPKFREVVENVEGRVLPPLVMYLFGVPFGVCLLVWLFFFRGR